MRISNSVIDWVLVLMPFIGQPFHKTIHHHHHVLGNKQNSFYRHWNICTQVWQTLPLKT